MTTHTLFPFAGVLIGEYDLSIVLVPEFLSVSPLLFPLSLFATQMGPSPRPSSFAFLIPQQSGIPLQAHGLTLEGKPQGTQTTPFLKCGRVLPFLHLHYTSLVGPQTRLHCGLLHRQMVIGC